MTRIKYHTCRVQLCKVGSDRLGVTCRHLAFVRGGSTRNFGHMRGWVLLGTPTPGTRMSTVMFSWRGINSNNSYKNTANKFAVLDREMCLSKP